MTTTDYFLATAAELTQACRGWASAGHSPAPDASPHAEYYGLPRVDLKGVDIIALAPLAAILLEIDVTEAEAMITSPLDGPPDCEEALFVLPPGLVQRLAELSDARVEAVVARWLVPMRDEVRSIPSPVVREMMLRGVTAENYVPSLRTLRDFARQAVGTQRNVYLLMAP